MDAETLASKIRVYVETGRFTGRQKSFYKKVADMIASSTIAYINNTDEVSGIPGIGASARSVIARILESERVSERDERGMGAAATRLDFSNNTAVVQCMADIAEALAHLDENDIRHGNVCIENISYDATTKRYILSGLENAIHGRVNFGQRDDAFSLAAMIAKVYTNLDYDCSVPRETYNANIEKTCLALRSARFVHSDLLLLCLSYEAHKRPRIGVVASMLGRKRK